MVERLLAEVSADAPCGPDLEYDPDFVALGVAATPKPEQRIGDSVVPARDPDWREVGAQATALLGRTKDLRVAVTLVRALMHTDGWPGLSDGLELVRGLLERQWDGVHPRLEAPDNDATYRLNTVAALADRDLTVPRLRLMPLVASRRLGRFSLRDLDVASGVLPKPPEDQGPPPDLRTIDAAFQDADAGRVAADAAAVGRALEHVDAIVAACAAKLSGQSPDLGALRGVLARAHQAYGERTGRAGAAAPAQEGTVADSVGGTGAAGAAPGEIRSREDVVQLLDRACDWFRRNEPSSPVPLLLERARRLVSKSYLEIMRDLAPSGLSEAENVVGRKDESS